MRDTYLATAAFLLLTLSWGGQAEIYTWKDAEGNTVFSDVPPPGKGADEVDLNEANIADSVEVQARQPEEAAREREQGKSQGGNGSYVVGGDDDPQGQIYEERRQRELRERAGDAKPGEPGDGVVNPRPLPARPRPSAGRR